ncbi:hypothetical protein [Streptomyces europaeiscabiei]|uniref:hypothetical protein n=1 Tax=Streptomyces europaeiscabiei TaxID=146819 RepID=UPI0029B0CE15|nr:hypothetical protein [Streptomyces europaeiscabiei]MDX3589078.1 hypothetical protein [Streptomyces europaeiscabiei]
MHGLDIPPGGIPFNSLRGQVHAVCGTGKTIIAAASAKRRPRHPAVNSCSIGPICFWISSTDGGSTCPG